MAEQIKKWKFFTLCDYEKEEAYLIRMHKQGWKLVTPSVGCFTFERCESEDYVYRLDFAAEYKDREEYLQMFRDYGWEYLGEVNDFTYFRRKASDTNDESDEIFSDNESRLQMMSKVLRWKMVPILLLFACGMGPMMARIFSGETSFSSFVCGTYGFLFGLYAVFFTYNFIGFTRLKKKYHSQN